MVLVSNLSFVVQGQSDGKNENENENDGGFFLQGPSDGNETAITG